MKSDTICAISTPIGVGGVSIIRLSGTCSKDIIGRIFDKAFLLEQKPRELILGEIKFNDFCDQALCVYFPNPNSFTGEDYRREVIKPYYDYLYKKQKTEKTGLEIL